MKKMMSFVIVVLTMFATQMLYADGYTLSLTSSVCTTYTKPSYSQIVGHWSDYGGGCKTSASQSGRACRTSTELVTYTGGCGPSCCCVEYLEAAGSITIVDNCNPIITSPGVPDYPGFDEISYEC
jgi:hypothetical protein